MTELQQTLPLRCALLQYTLLWTALLQDNKVKYSYDWAQGNNTPAEMTYHVLLVSPLTFQLDLPGETKIEAAQKKKSMVEYE